MQLLLNATARYFVLAVLGFSLLFLLLFNQYKIADTYTTLPDASASGNPDVVIDEAPRMIKESKLPQALTPQIKKVITPPPKKFHPSAKIHTLPTKIMTPTQEPEVVWGSIISGFRMNHHTETKEVKAHIREYLSDVKKLNRILIAATPYLYYIQKETKAKGLPAEIALVPFIESEFNPNDHSNKGALGLWQLMRVTAQELGIKIRHGYDGRRNVIDSTQAALAYFKDLGVLFKGNWYLALAAYNCGQVRIASAIRHAGNRNFWTLRLPNETKHYVPKLLAIAEIIKNHKKYRIQLPPIINQPYFAKLKMKKPAALKHIAKSTGIDIKQLQTLNPDYARTAFNKTAALLVPSDQYAFAKQQLSS